MFAADRHTDRLTDRTDTGKNTLCKLYYRATPNIDKGAFWHRKLQLDRYYCNYN